MGPFDPMDWSEESSWIGFRRDCEVAGICRSRFGSQSSPVGLFGYLQALTLGEQDRLDPAADLDEQEPPNLHLGSKEPKGLDWFPGPW